MLTSHQKKRRISWPFRLRRSIHATQLEMNWLLSEQRVLKSRSLLEWQRENQTVISRLSMITLELATTRGGHSKLITTWDAATDRGRICLTIETLYMGHRKQTHLVMGQLVRSSSHSSETTDSVPGFDQTIAEAVKKPYPEYALYEMRV